MFLSGKIFKYAILAGVFAFFLVGFLGFGHLAMAVHPDGQMSDCPFMGIAAVCQMSPFEHIAAWQSIFTLSAQSNTFTYIVLLLLALFSFIFLLDRYVFLKKLLPAKAIRCERTSFFLIPDPIQDAFSDGVLHTKIF